MEDDGMTRDAKGMIIAHPIKAFQSSIGGLATVWRIEWTEDRSHSKKPRAKSVQLYMDPNTARQIAHKILDETDPLPPQAAGSA